MKNRILSIFLVVAFIIGMFPFIHIVKASAENTNLMLWYKFSDSQGTTVTDSSGSGNDGIIKGSGGSITDDMLTLSDTSYVQLPTGMFDGHNSLTISMWLKNDTGKGNYAAMFFGTTESYPSQYWLFNPCNPSGLFKSVITNSLNASAPWNTEYGISPTKSSQGIAGPSTDNNWAFYTTVIEPNSITAYYNNVKIGTVATSRTVSDFGKNLVAYIGKSSYSDPYFKGSIKDVKVYSSALTETEVKNENTKTVLDKDKDALSFSDTSVASNLILPSSGANGSNITWKSSNTQYITDDGKVTRPENGNVNVTMTATLNKDGVQVTKDFNMVVIENSQIGDSAYLNNIASSFDIGIKYITQDISLPTSTKEGVSVSWKSSNENMLSSTGKVTRSESGDQNVTLTAILEFGQAKVEKTFDVTVAEKTYGYLLSYVVSGDTDRTDCLHLAYSEDGEDYTALHDNRGILYTSKGSNKMGSPAIFRKADGTYGLIASDDNKSSYIILMDSEDLLTYKNERYIQANNKGINVMNPSCRFDTEVNAYRIDFQGSDGKSYTTTTSDFSKFTDLEEISYAKEDFKGNLPEGAIESSVFEVTRTEYDKVIEKYSRVVNTGIKPLTSVEIQAGNTVALPEKVTAEYSDGSTKDMGVTWDQDQLKSIDTTKAGTYTIKGTVDQQIYSNPLIEERADPDAILGPDGYYYFTASYPTYGDSDPNGYDRIILRKATTIEGLKTADEITIWNKAYRYVWAPEIHNINGKWYVFYTSSVDSNNVWGIRPHVLACEGDGDPYKPENWVDKGQVKPVAGDNTSFTNFSLDMTYFECNGNSYVAWAEKPGGISNIYMATVDPSAPYQLTSNAILMTTPQYAWEWEGSTRINEGPAVLQHDGRIFLFYSAAAVDSTYCIGMLSADANADLMDISSWTKSAYPLLTSDDLDGEYGPGHNSFTVDAHGNDVIVYHARPLECLNNTCEYASSSDLNDPHRHARAKNINYAADGSPILNMTYEEELADSNKDVTVTVNIMKQEEGTSKVTGVTLDNKELSLVPGNTAQLTATVEPSDAADKNVTWTSSDENVVTVDNNGKVTAVADGTATITVTTEDGSFKDTCNVTVTVPTQEAHTFTYTAGDGGTITGTLSQTVNYEEKGTEVTAVANSGYHFVRWSDGVTSPDRVDTNSGSDIHVTAIFESDAVPVVTEIDPISGPISGGTNVTIKGENFIGVTGVKFGDNDAESYTVNNENEISAITPAGEEGTVDVIVTTEAGTITGSAVQFTYIDGDDNNEPSEGVVSGVKIKGTEKVGNTLIADLIDENGNIVTTSAGVTYEWYRSANSDFEDAELVGEDSSYKLVSGDAGKYIKLIVNFIDEIFEDITSKIANNSSSSSSHHHSSSSSSSNSSNSTSSDSTSATTESGDNNKPSTSTNEGTTNTIIGNWQKSEQGWKYIENNAPVTGWKQINNIWYLMDSTGVMQTGWQQVNDDWYLLKDDGAMATGWQQVNGAWYLLKDDGAMATGWQQVNGKWYYLYTNGSMASNTVIDGYTLDESGAWI